MNFHTRMTMCETSEIFEPATLDDVISELSEAGVLEFVQPLIVGAQTISLDKLKREGCM